MLTCLLHQSIRWGVLHGVRVARGATPISHLMFANDLIIFCRANCREVREVLSLMQQYCLWSGQAINISKSSIAFSGNTHPELKTAIFSEFRFQEMQLGSSYLGLPLYLSRSKRSAFAELKVKVLRKLQGWKARVLS